MKINVYADDIYMDKDGRYYTGSCLRDKEGYTKVEDKFSLFNSHTEIMCNYDQIFFPDSSLILCNNIEKIDGFWDGLENGSLNYYYDSDYNECDEDDASNIVMKEIFQWFIIDRHTAEFLMEHTDEIIVYVEFLDVYALGVTHYGTMWCGVETMFKL